MPSPTYSDGTYNYYVDPLGNVWKVDPKTNKGYVIGKAKSKQEAIQLIKSKTKTNNSKSSSNTSSSNTETTGKSKPTTLTTEQAAEKLVEAAIGSIGYVKKRERISAGVYKFVTASGTTIIVDVNTNKVTYTTSDGRTRTVTYNPEQAQQKVQQIQQEVEQYNREVEQLNKQIEAFNKKYGGRALSPEEYKKALAEQKRLEQKAEELQQKYKQVALDIPKIRPYSTIAQVDTQLDKLVPIQKHIDILKDLQKPEKREPPVMGEVRPVNIKGWKATALGEWYYTAKELWEENKDIAAPITAAYATIHRRLYGYRDYQTERVVSFIGSWLELEGAARVVGFAASRLAKFTTESRAVSSGANLNIEVIGKTQTAIKLRDVKSPRLQKFANKLNRIIIGATKRTIHFNEERVAGYIRGFTNEGDKYEVLVKPLKNNFIKLTLKRGKSVETAVVKVKKIEDVVAYKGVTSKGKVIEGVESASAIFKGVGRDPIAKAIGIVLKTSTKTETVVPKTIVQPWLAHSKFLEKVSEKAYAMFKLGGFGTLIGIKLKNNQLQNKFTTIKQPATFVNINIPNIKLKQPFLNLTKIKQVTTLKQLQVTKTKEQVITEVTTTTVTQPKLEVPTIGITPPKVEPPKPPPLKPPLIKLPTAGMTLPFPSSWFGKARRLGKKKVWNIVPSLARIGKVKIKSPKDVAGLTLAGVVLRKRNKSRKTKKKK